MSCSRTIEFEDRSIGKLLWIQKQRFEAQQNTYIGDLPVGIIKVDMIRIKCNIVTGSFQNGAVSRMSFSLKYQSATRLLVHPIYHISTC